MAIYIEDYVVECISSNKKVSGHKLKQLDYRLLPELYCKAKNITMPVCAMCEKFCCFKSIAKGFGKYCGKECALLAMSDRNKKTNADKNKALSEKNLQDLRPTLLVLYQFYIDNPLMTIKEVAETHNFPYSTFRKFLIRENLLDVGRRSKIKKHKIDKEFANINSFLDDVETHINNGKSSKEIASLAGCSKNYMHVYLRKQGFNFSRNIISSYEDMIRSIIEDFGYTSLRNTRSVISPMELDIYVLEKSVAIEVNGVYWHDSSDQARSQKEKNYHKNKTDRCRDKGIRLLHFTDVEIENKYSIVKSIIGSALGQSKIIGARKCDIREIDNTTYKNFCNDNHIQGYAPASVKLGLFFENRLVSIISYGKPRFNKQYEYELIRYCNIIDHSVMGGSSKLHKHFMKRYNPKGIISYSQRRLFAGNLYENIGMHHSHTSEPNYIWVNKNGETKSRYQSQKHKLNTLLTENEYMKANGYFKIYDSGNDVYLQQLCT
jgi:hypothetical protein